ncbi:MAG: hypothetical protein Roseis2KO_56430 [Roseivirga sp.]
MESETSAQNPIHSQGKDEVPTISESPYQASTYKGNTDRIKYHKNQLQELSASVFVKIHEQLSTTLKPQHKAHIDSLNFQLLFFGEGGLYDSTGRDIVFVVYDSAMTRVRVLLYNSVDSRYAELYDDMKVINELSEVPCGAYTNQSLDYTLGEEIIYRADFLKRKPQSYYGDGPKVKIANLAKDSDLLPDMGCITNPELKTATFNSLCFSTDNAYNNWTCMRYDAKSATMITYYKQVFAD